MPNQSIEIVFPPHCADELIKLSKRSNKTVKQTIASALAYFEIMLDCKERGTFVIAVEPNGAATQIPSP